MYPCSLRMRAISTLSLLEGIRAFSCAAWIALRIRVKKSAMGSVMDIVRYLPAALRHPGDVTVMRELAQADSADAELAVDGPGAAAPAAAGVFTGLVLRGARLADALRGLRHALLLILSGK